MTDSRTFMVSLALLNLYVYCVISAFDLTILHTNDVHDRFEQFEGKNGAACSEEDANKGICFGGVSRRLTKIREIRNEEKNVIFLDGGDQYLGTLWFNLYGGNATATFMNNLTYDVMTLGNHEFDTGVEGLLPLLTMSKFKIVCSNLDASREPRLQRLFTKSTVLTVAGEKIGVIGYVLPATKYISNPGQTIDFVDEIGAIKAEVRKLENDGVNKIIALGHSGFQKDQEIARSVSGIDIVVGGHTDTFLYSGKPPSTEISQGDYPFIVRRGTEDKVLLVQDYTYGKYLGKLKVTFDDNGVITNWCGNPILLNSSVIQDPEMEAEVQKWAKSVSSVKLRHVGNTRVYLEGKRAVCRQAECNLGNLIADAMVHRYLGRSSKKSWADVGLAIHNAGSIRSSVEQGDVNLENVIRVQPFRNTITRLEILGEHLWEAFEFSVKDFTLAALNGKFLQIAGFRIVYDLRKPNNHRVISVDVRCTRCLVPKFEPIVLRKAYSVVVPTYLAMGGDGYTVFLKKALSSIDTGDTDVDVTAEYFKKFDPLWIGLEGRIQFDNSSHSLANVLTGAFS